MSQTIHLNGRPVGEGHAPYIIAELSCNHVGDIEKAYRIMERMAETGVDALKLQTYEAGTITLDGPQEFYQLNHPEWNGMSYYDLYQKAQTPFGWMEKLFKKGQELGLTVFSTPFDVTAVDVLEELNAPFYKVASFENCHIPLIEKVAKTGKPVIISTGLATEADIQLAVETARNAGCKDLILLHCVSSYPGKLEEMNLATIPDMAQKFGVMTGLSNHYIGDSPANPDLEAIYAAFKQGAAVLEMHVMENADDTTFDQSFSITPDAFRQLVDGIPAALAQPMTDHQKKAIGSPNYTLTQGEKDSLPIRPAIKAARAIQKGETFTEENLVVRRPGVGLPPKYWHDIIGQTATQDIDFADGVTEEMVSGMTQTAATGTGR